MPADPRQLYGLPLEEFTAARNALAKELVRAGDKAGAEAVRRLVKPSKTAWALNQLARRQPEDVEQLLAAGQRLREAQQRALAGDASQLRAATRAEQQQVDRLLDAAVALLGGPAGGGGSAADRLRSTLRAAATDPATGERLREGRLVADVEPTGFGLEGLPDLLPDLAVADGAGAAVGESTEPGGGGEEEAAAERARRQARREAHRQAQREAERLRRDAERLRDRAMRLMEQAEVAERRAREARQEAEAAAEAAQEAERRALDAAGQVATLERNR